jgi:hypothetical protein
MSIRPFPLLLAALVSVASSALVSAQPLGTFRWRQLPYCNVITVNVVQNGAVYHIDGTDDQCGSARLASVSGLGFVNPNGTIGLGLTIVTNDGGGNGGAPLHLDVILALPAANGNWRDNTGASGPFELVAGPTPPGPAPRPAPVPAFSGGLAAGGARVTNVGAPSAGTDAVNKTYVDTNVRAALLNVKSWTAEVSTTGTKVGTGRFSSSRTATGTYSVTFDLTGLDVVAHASFFNWVVTPRCAGFIAAVNGRSAVASGAFTTQQSANVAVTDAAGAAANCTFFVTGVNPDADSPGSPVPPFVHAAPAPGVSCTTAGETTTCVERAPG